MHESEITSYSNYSSIIFEFLDIESSIVKLIGSRLISISIRRIRSSYYVDKLTSGRTMRTKEEI